jgi:hypothetical protein
MCNTVHQHASQHTVCIGSKMQERWLDVGFQGSDVLVENAANKYHPNIALTLRSTSQARRSAAVLEVM